MVGRGGVEPPTSRLSGVRSNHLSYRPPHSHPIRQKPFGLARPARAHPSKEGCSRMKGHEDGGNVLRIWKKLFRSEDRRFLPQSLERSEERRVGKECVSTCRVGG